MTKGLLKFLRDNRVLLAKASQENWIRKAISETIHDLLIEADRCERDGDTPVEQIVQALIEAINQPDHFGDNTPGFCNAQGALLIDDPQFDWWDLLDFGSTNEGGLPRFLSECGLPHSTSESALYAAVGLLLVHDALEAVNSGKPFLSAHLLHRADWCVQEARLHKLSVTPTKNVKEAIREILSARGRNAGLRSAATRQANALSSTQIQKEADALIAGGKEPRGVTAILATRHGVSTEHIRKLRKKTSN